MSTNWRAGYGEPGAGGEVDGEPGLSLYTQVNIFKISSCRPNNQYARRPWEAGYIGQYGSGRRHWDSDLWRRQGHQGGLSVFQEEDWRPPVWEDSDLGEVEPEEVEGVDQEECDWLCVQERMQDLARQVEQVQEERRTQEEESQETENPASARRDHVELFPDGNWDPAGTRRMPEWRQGQAEDEERRRESSPSSSSCTGMCRLMRMRTGK